MSDNLNALSSLMAAGNPMTQANQAVQMQRGYQDLQTQRFQLQQAQLQPAYQAMRQIMATNPNPSWDDVNYALGQARRLGANVDGLVANAAETAGKNGNAADFMRANALGGLTPYEQMGMVAPSVEMVQTPQGLQPTLVGGALGPHPGSVTPSSGFIPYGLSPHDWAQPVQKWDPNTQTYTMVPFGQAYGYPAPPGLAGTSGTGSGTGTSAAIPAGLPKGEFLQRAAQRESGGDPTALNYVARADPTAYARGATASGKYQFVNSTWRQGLQWAGLDPNQYPTAMSAPEGIQDQVASVVYDHLGEQPWQKGSQDWVRGPNGQFTLASVPAGTGSGTAAPPGLFIGQAISAPAPPGSVTQAPPVPMAPRSLPMAPPGFDKTAGASADMFNNARASYNAQVQRVAPLQQSLATLRAHPDLQTGMTAGDWQNINSLAQVLGVQLSPETIANGTALTEINKNLNRYYRSMPGASRSDMAELDAKLSSPNVDMQRAALDDLLARTIGTEMAADAPFLNFQQQHGAANASQYAHLYADQVGGYANSIDPMGFAFKSMSSQERRAYLDSLTDPQARQRYLNSIKEASRLYNLSIQ